MHKKTTQVQKLWQCKRYRTKAHRFLRVGVWGKWKNGRYVGGICNRAALGFWGGTASVPEYLEQMTKLLAQGAIFHCPPRAQKSVRSNRYIELKVPVATVRIKNHLCT